MRLSEDPVILAELKATGEIYSRHVSAAAAAMFLTDLDQYTSAQVMKALGKCRRELKTFPSVADVIARVDDGRPGVEEAWTMLPKDEDASVVWTDEMAQAFDVVRREIDSDRIAARMAFKEAYGRAITESRERGEPVRWTASLGHDRHQRAACLNAAVAKGRITADHARELCPALEHSPRSSGLAALNLASILTLIEAKALKERETE